jgi:GT2 family glycosyltransferase
VDRSSKGCFSIVIPTHNRYEKLKNLLDTIDRVNPPNLEEVIIVDDSEKKEHIFTGYGNLAIRIITSENRMFISEAKNRGFSETTSGIVFFIDDDNQVDESTFYCPVKLLIENSDFGAVFPSVLYQRAKEIVWVYATPFKKHRWGHELIGRNRKRDPWIENRTIDIDALPNSFAIRKSALEQVGGFSKHFPVYNSAYLALSLKENGWRVVAHTGSFIYHDVELPLEFGYWAEHEVSDPDRVKIEVADWFRFMRVVHRRESMFLVRALARSAFFIAPNSIAYILKGNKLKYKLIRKEIEGLIDGLKGSTRSPLK